MMKVRTGFIPAVAMTITGLLLAVLPLRAEEEAPDTGDFLSPTIGGATGAIATPSARTGWQKTDFALDAGYHLIYDEGRLSNIPLFNIYFIKMVELGFAYDAQGVDGDDFIVHAKVSFTKSEHSFFAIGGNFQGIRERDESRIAPHGQLYFAFTYAGDFFSMPVETSVLCGKTFKPRDQDLAFDFSMSLSLDLFPSVLKHYVCWISDIANYSYSVNPHGVDYQNRGCFNTGLRIAILQGLERFKLNLDIVGTDLFDQQDRGMSVGVAFGMRVL